MKPRFHLTARATAGLVAAMVLAGCPKTEDQTTSVYAPYAGDEPYPNRRPKLVMPAGDVGLVSNNGSDTITMVDLANAKVLGNAPVGRDPVGIDGPHHVAADRARGFAYVALAYPAPAAAPGPHAAHGASTRSGFVQKLALDDLRVMGEVRVDPNPGDIVLSDDHSRMVVSHFDLKAALSGKPIAENRATLTLVDQNQISFDSPDPPRVEVCVAPHGVALSRPDGATAYVACYGEDAVAVVDVAHPSNPVLRVPMGSSLGTSGAPQIGPYSIVLSPSGKLAAVGDTEAKDVRFFDTTTKTMTKVAVTLRGAAFFPAWAKDEKTIYIPTQAPDVLAVAEAATGAVLTQRNLDDCGKPHEAVFSTDFSTIYVVCEGDHVTNSVILALDPTTLATKSRIPVGVYPDRLLIMKAP